MRKGPGAASFHRVLPDGCMDLLFDFMAVKSERASVIGTMTRPLTVTVDVPALFARAVNAGGTAVTEPATKPWGETVAYLRDNSGHLVELCTPLS